MSGEPLPQEGPRTAAGEDAEPETSDSEDQGQVSEVQRLDEDDADTPISPEDSTAGYPDSESGGPDTGGSGPDSAPPENRDDNEYGGPGHRHPGQGIDQG